MRRFWAIAMLVAVVVGLSSVPGAVVHASTVQGAPVVITGLDSLSATADTQARTGAGKVLGMFFGIGGIGAICAGRVGLGATAVGSGLGMGFLPGMISSAFDAAPAATGEVIILFSEKMQILAGFLGLRAVQDPVFYLALGLGMLLVLHYRVKSEVQSLA